MSIGPDVWGPHGWKFLHFVALAYSNTPSDDDKNNYKTFFTSIGNILPCSLCSKHYKDNLNKNPLTDKVLSNRRNLLYWTIDIHNEVNKINNKPELDYTTAIELIKNNFQNNSKIENFENITGYTSELEYANLKTNNDQNNNTYLNNNTDTHKSETKIIKPHTNFFKYLIIFTIIIIIVIGLFLYKKK